tara:strand:+ start:12648 stop:12917 length:270 start_codon:yes stop_codon:yes gene_type:complete
MKIRVLCCVISCDDLQAIVEVVALGTVTINRAELPDDINRCLDVDYRFHARATVLNDKIQEFHEFEWDGQTLAEQKEGIKRAAKQFGLD